VVPASLRDLQPQLGQKSLIIQRVHRVHGAPYALTTSYVPESLGRKIRKSTLSRGSLLTVIDQLGPRTTRTEYTASAVAADAIAARRLDVPLGAPLLRTRAVLTDNHGQLHAVIESLCRPDRFNLHAALERGTNRHSSASWRLKRNHD
jgi:GntR family transcriptional regulator